MLYGLLECQISDGAWASKHGMETLQSHRCEILKHEDSLKYWCGALSCWNCIQMALQSSSESKMGCEARNQDKCFSRCHTLHRAHLSICAVNDLKYIHDPRLLSVHTKTPNRHLQGAAQVSRLDQTHLTYKNYK